MSVLEIEKLLTPVSDDAPCGENLEYDAVFMQMEQASQPKPDQQFGDTIVPGEEPDWRTVAKLGQELLERTRDLRILTHLSRALLQTEGLAGFRDVVTAMHRLVAERWESVHPQLDPDDGNDPTLRVNLIASLTDSDTTLKYLHAAPIVKARAIGRYSLRDYDIATGELSVPTPEGVELPKPETIQAAFREAELSEIEADAAACREALAAIVALEAALTDQVGAAQAASLEELRRMLKRMTSIYDEQLERRGVRTGEAESAEGTASADANGTSVAVVQRIAGEVETREDVIRALDKICEYYVRHEPSSPVPMLLKRAKRLASMSFLEIVRDLSPETLQQVMAWGGADENGTQE